MSDKPQTIPEDSSSNKRPHLTEEEFREMVRQACIKYGLDPDKVKWKEKSSPPVDYNVTVVFLRKRPHQNQPPLSKDQSSSGENDKNNNP